MIVLFVLVSWLSFPFNFMSTGHVSCFAITINNQLFNLSNIMYLIQHPRVGTEVSFYCVIIEIIGIINILTVSQLGR